MVAQKIKLDINAHIKNISVRIDSASSQAIVSFENLGYGTIKAVKFKAKGYNDFQDIITVSGKEEFFIVIQDLDVLPNSKSKDIKINLPSCEIKRIDLEEYQICLDNNNILTYLGSDLREFDLSEYETIDEDKEKIVALRDRFGSQYRYVPKDFDCGWICCCGTYNSTEAGICNNCKCKRAEVFETTDETVVAGLIEQYKVDQELKAQQKEKEEIQKAKDKKSRNTKIGIGIAIGLVIVILFSYLITMAGRTTYDSVDEMKSDIEGVYTQYKNGKAYHQIKISGDKLTYQYVSSGLGNTLDIKSYNPKNGTFEASFAHCIVKSNGDIVFDGDLHEKGGSWKSGGSSSSNSYESAYSVLKISGVSVTSNSSYTVCTGTITNNGKKTYKYVEIKGSFKNSSGTVLDTDWTYAVGSEGLAPGESKTFRMSVPKNYDIKSCSVSITDYD